MNTIIDFSASELVEPTTYETHGLCEGIPLRSHKDSLAEIRGAIRCQRDWSKLVCPVRNYKGTIGTPFSFVRVTIPETLPGRLELCSYANEYAFLYDGSDKVSSGKLQGAKQIQGNILTEMIAIDRERAITTMKLWQQYVRTVSSRQRSQPFNDLKEYLPYRISDAGELFWFGLVTFAMGLTIPEHEFSLSKSLSFASWSALALTNDLYSWEKERKEASRKGETHVMNAIWVLMVEHDILELEAKERYRSIIRQNVADAIRISNETNENTMLSISLRRYIQAILFSISGNLVWSIYCPRYHPDIEYNQEVLRAMEQSMDENKITRL
nr:fusicoccadiene synthase [Quercus suber]